MEHIDEYLERIQTEVKTMLKPFDEEREKLQARKEEAQAKMAAISPESTNFEDLKTISEAGADLVIIDKGLEKLDEITRKAMTNYDLKSKMEQLPICYAGGELEEKAQKETEDFIAKILDIEEQQKQATLSDRRLLQPYYDYLCGLVADYQLVLTGRDWNDEAEKRKWRNMRPTVWDSFKKQKVLKKVSDELFPYVPGGGWQY